MWIYHYSEPAKLIESKDLKDYKGWHDSPAKCKAPAVKAKSKAKKK